jgi:hypothetical protein
MVAKQPYIPTKFSALQFRGVEFDTKPCSVDRDLTSVSRVDRRLGLNKNLGCHIFCGGI